MEAIYEYLSGAKELYVNVYIGVLRYAAPILAFILLWRCLKPLHQIHLGYQDYHL